MQRGDEVVGPMTISEIAGAVGLSDKRIRDFIEAGFLEVDRSTRPYQITGGLVPLGKREWLHRLLSTPGVKPYLIGQEEGSLAVLVQGEIRWLAYAPSNEEVEKQQATLSAWMALTGVRKSEQVSQHEATS